ncbi:MAG: hypothetical protein WCX83_02120 [Candidatus Cloacimonas sp.]|nr:hypothetical protein [Candidatus Cloacimonadota bacterium]
MNYKQALIVALLAVLILVTACSIKKQEPTEEDLQAELYSRLRISKITKLNQDHINQVQLYNRKGRLINEKWYNLNMTIVTQRNLKYNPKTDRNIETEWLKGEDIFKSRNIFEYDSQRRLKRIYWINSSEEQVGTSDYLYNKEGKLESVTRYDGRNNIVSTQKYRYENGKLMEYINEDRGGKVTSRQVYQYSDAGVKTEEEWYDSQRNRTTNKYYKYDVAGNLVEELELRNGEHQHRLLKEYDENGLLLSEEWLNEEGEQMFQNTFEYEYFND